jgi:hypothetical protein
MSSGNNNLDWDGGSGSGAPVVGLQVWGSGRGAPSVGLQVWGYVCGAPGVELRVWGSGCGDPGVWSGMWRQESFPAHTPEMTPGRFPSPSFSRDRMVPNCFWMYASCGAPNGDARAVSI